MKILKISFLLGLVVLSGCTAREDDQGGTSDSRATATENETLKDAVRLEEEEQFDTLEYDIVAEQRRRNEYVEDLWQFWARTGLISRDEIFGDLNTRDTVQGFLASFHPPEKHIILENEDRHECNDLYLLGLLGPEDDMEEAYKFCFNIEEDDSSDLEEDPIPDVLKTLNDWEKVQDDIADVTDEICSNHKSSESCD